MKHHIIRVVIIVSLFCSNVILSSQSFYLKHVLHPSSVQIEAQKKSQWNRQIKRSIVKYGSITAIVTALYLSYKASEYFKSMAKDVEKLKETQACNKLFDKMEELKQAQHALQTDKDNGGGGEKKLSLLAPVWWVTGGVKSLGGGVASFSKDLGKCFIETAPLFIASKMLDTGWSNLSDKRAEVLKEESINWFFENYTCLPYLFVDLKKSCASYDLYSELLSSDALQTRTNLHLKAFVKGLSDIVKARKQEGLLDDEYFEYQCDEVKKQFAKKGNEIEVLQNYAIPVAAKKQRLIDTTIEDVCLFGTANIGKQDISEMCNLLATDVQKIAAFAIAHIDQHRELLTAASIKRGETKVKQIIEVTNAYLDQMQQLLNMDLQQLVDMSKKNRGMFTISYEFERIFKDMLNAVHSYCIMIEK